MIPCLHFDPFKLFSQLSREKKKKCSSPSKVNACTCFSTKTSSKCLKFLKGYYQKDSVFMGLWYSVNGNQFSTPVYKQLI